MTTITIDATGTIVGRMASHIAKQALLGHKVNVINSEKAIITGSKANVEEHYWKLHADIGQQAYGPFIPKMPDRFVRRIIRGMLPRRKARGLEAFHRVMCYIGVPVDFANIKAEKLTWATQPKTTKVQTIGDICKTLGWKG